LPKFDPFISKLDSLRDHIETLADDQQGVPIAAVELGSPIANPGKIIAAPLNYQRHLEEARDDPAIHHNNRIVELPLITPR